MYGDVNFVLCPSSGAAFAPVRHVFGPVGIRECELVWKWEGDKAWEPSSWVL